MKTEILKIKGTWQDVVDDCRSSVSKPPLGKEPGTQFKVGILISEHTPIRNISFRWKWAGIPSWVSVHFVRNIFYKVVSTQRTDRTGIPREKLPQDQPVDYVGEANVQHLIDTSRKRMCYTASKETREYWEDLKASIREVSPEVAFVMQKNCVYRGGCPEMNSCGWYQGFLKRNPDIESRSIEDRYDAADDEFYG